MAETLQANEPGPELDFPDFSLEELNTGDEVVEDYRNYELADVLNELDARFGDQIFAYDHGDGRIFQGTARYIVETCPHTQRVATSEGADGVARLLAGNELIDEEEPKDTEESEDSDKEPDLLANNKTKAPIAEKQTSDIEKAQSVDANSPNTPSRSWLKATEHTMPALEPKPAAASAEPTELITGSFVDNTPGATAKQTFAEATQELPLTTPTVSEKIAAPEFIFKPNVLETPREVLLPANEHIPVTQPVLENIAVPEVFLHPPASLRTSSIEATEVITPAGLPDIFSRPAEELPVATNRVSSLDMQPAHIIALNQEVLDLYQDDEPALADNVPSLDPIHEISGEITLPAELPVLSIEIEAVPAIAMPESDSNEYDIFLDTKSPRQTPELSDITHENVLATETTDTLLADVLAFARPNIEWAQLQALDPANSTAEASAFNRIAADINAPIIESRRGTIEDPTSNNVFATQLIDMLRADESADIIGQSFDQTIEITYPVEQRLVDLTRALIEAPKNKDTLTSQPEIRLPLRASIFESIARLELLRLYNTPSPTAEGQAEITPDIQAELLRLLRLMGYSHPEETLAHLVATHGNSYVHDIIRYLSALMHDEYREFLRQKLTDITSADQEASNRLQSVACSGLWRIAQTPRCPYPHAESRASLSQSLASDYAPNFSVRQLAQAA